MTPTNDAAKIAAGLTEEAINLEAGDYLAPDGVVYPIVSYLDGDGEECEWFEAKAVVAGAGSKWFSVALEGFERTTWQ